MFTAIARAVGADLDRCDPRCCDIELLFATPFERNEPKGSTVDTMAAGGQKPMILMQGRFYPLERFGDIAACMIFNGNGTCLIPDDHVIFVKGAGILGYRFNRSARGAPRRAVSCVCVTHGDNVGMFFVNIRVQTNPARLTA